MFTASPVRPSSGAQRVTPAVLLIALSTLVLLLGGCGDSGVDSNEDDEEEPPPSAAITVSPASVSFGEVPADEEEEAKLTIENTGDAALEGSVSLSGDTAYALDVDGDFSIPAGQETTFTLTFAPSAITEYATDVQVSHNADNVPSPAQVAVEGKGISPLPTPPDRP